MSKTNTPTKIEQQIQPEVTTELATNLTLGDLKLMISIIDAVTAKGILRANELTIVGGLYDKINEILGSANIK